MKSRHEPLPGGRKTGESGVRNSWRRVARKRSSCTVVARPGGFPAARRSHLEESAPSGHFSPPISTVASVAQRGEMLAIEFDCGKVRGHVSFRLTAVADLHFPRGSRHEQSGSPMPELRERRGGRGRSGKPAGHRPGRWRREALRPAVPPLHLPGVSPHLSTRLRVQQVIRLKTLTAFLGWRAPCPGQVGRLAFTSRRAQQGNVGRCAETGDRPDRRICPHHQLGISSPDVVDSFPSRSDGCAEREPRDLSETVRPRRSGRVRLPERGPAACGRFLSPRYGECNFLRQQLRSAKP